MRFRAKMSAPRLVGAAIVLAVMVGAVGCGSSHRGAAAPVGSSRRSTSTVARSTTAVPTTAPTTVPPTTVPSTTVPPTTIPPTTAAPGPPPTVAGAGVAVGDSVLEDVQLYAPATLQSRNISINAAVSRQWAVGIGILSALKAGGKLPPVVIVALGSNGRISDALFDQMIQACAGAKRVVFMTVTGPLIGNNPIIHAGVARYPGSAALADWYTLATAHPEWFAPDHVHVGPAGATALGNLLASFS